MSNLNLVQERVQTTMEKLNKIAEANLNGVVDHYKDETRTWWDQVDEEAIYEAIGEPEFDVYVRLFVTEDTHYGNNREAA